jgi:hypothetical protein
MPSLPTIRYSSVVFELRTRFFFNFAFHLIFSKAGLYITGWSNGVRVDSSPPVMTATPAFDMSPIGPISVTVPDMAPNHQVRHPASRVLASHAAVYVHSARNLALQ